MELSMSFLGGKGLEKADFYRCFHDFLKCFSSSFEAPRLPAAASGRLADGCRGPAAALLGDHPAARPCAGLAGALWGSPWQPFESAAAPLSSLLRLKSSVSMAMMGRRVAFGLLLAGVQGLLLSEEPRVELQKGFLTKAEVAAVLELAEEEMFQDSTCSDDGEEGGIRCFWD